MPEQAAGAKHVLVTEDLWLFLCENSNKVKPEDASVCSTFLSIEETCPIYNVKLNKVACSDDTLRALKVKERQNHEKLLRERILCFIGCKYYLLPSSWLTKWKTFITSSVKSASPSARLDPLQGVIDSLTCEKTDGLTIISESDWNFFCEDWQCAISKCLSAKIEFSSGEVKKMVGSCEEMPISEESLNPSSDRANDEVESRQPTINTYPMAR